MNHHICKTCGATLVRRDEFTWECKYCKNTYEDSLVVSETLAMRKVLDEEKLARVANLRQSLYKELTARIFDRDKIIEYCTSLKKYLPNDFPGIKRTDSETDKRIMQHSRKHLISTSCCSKQQIRTFPRHTKPDDRLPKQASGSDFCHNIVA